VRDRNEIELEVKTRGITRLCHFTPSRNLAQILTGKAGILATSKLQEDERLVYAPTDLQRLDGYTGHICCSIQYPNTWYFERARGKEMLFKDWVVLFIRPTYLCAFGTKFCPRNAATRSGQEVCEGIEGLRRLFEARTIGAYGRVFERSALTPPCCPTDEQAEVLIPDTIALADILGIAVRDQEQAQNERIRLKLLGIEKKTRRALNFSVVPEFWDKYALSTMLKSGKHPREEKVDPEVE
jgi:ssDNA thymidine ADP-ribosyltransferase, DarT